MKMGLLSRFLSGYTLIIGSHIRKQLGFLKEKVPPGFKYRQLDDLGCGDGKITLLLKEIFSPTRLRGFDVNPNLVKRAKDRGIDADVRDLEGDMPTGELGVMWGVLHHLEDKQACLRRLKENYSLIFIREPVKASPTKGLELGDPLRKEEIEQLFQEYLAGSQVFYCDNNILLFYASPNAGDTRIESAEEGEQGKGSMIEINDAELAVQEEAQHLAQQLFGNDIKKCATFTDRLLDTYAKAKGKDFLLMHNPGGWGSKRLENCLPWERSVVEGVNATMEGLGYTCLVNQYFRSGSSKWAHLGDAKEEARYFIRGESFRARVMAAELRFIGQHISELKVILIGASQGAAFGNIVLQYSNGLDHVYSIEVGLPFYYASRRVITKRTLAVDSNGLRLDDMVSGNVMGGFQAYVIGPFKWLWYRLQGKPARFAQCISAPGHDYNWEYPEVRQKIEDFLTASFGTKSKSGGGVS